MPLLPSYTGWLCLRFLLPLLPGHFTDWVRAPLGPYQGPPLNLSHLDSGAPVCAKRASRRDTRLLPGFVGVTRRWPLRSPPGSEQGEGVVPELGVDQAGRPALQNPSDCGGPRPIVGARRGAPRLL